MEQATDGKSFRQHQTPYAQSVESEPLPKVLSASQKLSEKELQCPAADRRDEHVAGGEQETGLVP